MARKLRIQYEGAIYHLINRGNYRAAVFGGKNNEQRPDPLRPPQYISISEIIRKAHAQYAKAFLYTEIDDNDLTYFLLHQTKVIQQAVDAFRDHVEDKANNLRKLDIKLQRLGNLNPRQQDILSHALRKPLTQYTVKSHQNSQHIATLTARKDLEDLVAKKLFHPQKHGRKVIYQAEPDLEQRLALLR
jgi:Fic family protein